ncbi:hypothetical protein [Oceanirhabdus sp. W0125-5]|uniref:hypothetical protein n=1 Tax=Oceanirhabdus sp. W0125-5 TaxID=2999116 RepID=UPI0022F2CEC9|nr:hypothetical protein [Oceanirhabdus sp. W0125-5]WBW96235.1 hypothetical protein OW730_21460 [Oceanirhabdus sp. W0125-5]
MKLKNIISFKRKEKLLVFDLKIIGSVSILVIPILNWYVNNRLSVAYEATELIKIINIKSMRYSIMEDIIREELIINCYDEKIGEIESKKNIDEPVLIKKKYTWK